MKFTGRLRSAALKGDDKPSWLITIAVPRKNIQNANDLAGLQGQAVNVEMMAVQVKMPLEKEDSGELPKAKTEKKPAKKAASAK